MLKKIKLDNYTTFIKPTEIDFSATNYKFLESENVGSNKILKGCLFVGENASGKTKILKSITLLLDLLFGNSEVDLMSNKSFYTSKPTYKLEYTFIEEGKEIIYLIELNLNEIVSEKLIFDKQIILERLGTTAKFNLNGNEILNKWFEYMKKSVYINCYYRKVFNYSGTNLLVHEYLNNNTVDAINKFLEKIDYKQTIEYGTETSNPNKKFFVKSNDNKKFISFNKKGTDIYIPEMFESTGNKTFMELLPSFLHAINNECMIIIDEFSSGFHNELEECIVKYFFHYSKNSQLFFTSHSTNILNNTLIRPDQLYSVSFDPKEGSVLKRFSEEMPRESQNTEKMYLNGVFNGMPRYNKIFKD